MTRGKMGAQFRRISKESKNPESNADFREKGRIVLLRVGTAIVTMSEQGIKRLK